MTTYTVYSPASGTVYGENLSVTEAAEIILTHDGHEYELRLASGRPLTDQPGFDLFISRGSRNSFGGTRGMTQAWRGGKPIWSLETDPKKAWQDIAKQVVTAGWDNVPEAMTTEDYNAMMAEAAAE